MRWMTDCTSILGLEGSFASRKSTFWKKNLKVFSFFCRARLEENTKFISLFQGCMANISRSCCGVNSFSSTSLCNDVMLSQAGL